jgi:hypothetical protein
VPEQCEEALHFGLLLGIREEPARVRVRHPARQEACGVAGAERRHERRRHAARAVQLERQRPAALPHRGGERVGDRAWRAPLRQGRMTRVLDEGVDVRRQPLHERAHRGQSDDLDARAREGATEGAEGGDRAQQVAELERPEDRDGPGE